MSSYTKSWKSIIEDQFHAIMRKHDMPDDIAIEIENFFMTTVKDQFRAGSISGAAWQKQQSRLKNNQQSMGLSGALPA